MRALVADDDELMLALFEAVLLEAGHQVVLVTDGLEAWTRYDAEPFPLVVLDWQMPGLEGPEVCRRIRARASGGAAFVVMVTARDSRADLARVLDAGADDYLTKPVSLDNLRARFTIASRRIAQDELRRQAERALGRATWLAGIGETTLALQHEINNPLAALLGNAALIEGNHVQGDEMRQCVHVMAEQAQRISEVVKRLSRLENPRSVEYLKGAKMIDLARDEGRGTRDEGDGTEE